MLDGLFEKSGLRVFITTDTQVAPNQMDDFRDMADFIFQDCETAKFWSPCSCIVAWAAR